MHADWPCEPCAEPGLQAWHADCPATANVPAPQLEQAAESLWPVRDWNLPLRQSVHTLLPTPLW